MVEKRPTPVTKPDNGQNENQPEPFQPLEPIKPEAKKALTPKPSEGTLPSAVVTPAYGRYIIGLVIIFSFVAVGAFGLKESAENRVDGL